MEFYICNHCKNVATKVVDAGANLVCCGDNMELLNANTVDAALEKHIPVLNVDNNTLNIKVGSVLHPMDSDHYIMFIAVVKKSGAELIKLAPGGSLELNVTKNENDIFIEVYAYCNLHGLWKTTV